VVKESPQINEAIERWWQACPDKLPAEDLIHAVALFAEGMLWSIAKAVQKAGMSEREACDSVMKLYTQEFVGAAQLRSGPASGEVH
jgi:hypothetical protein